MDGFMLNPPIDLFNTNASIVRDLAKAAAESAPEANILVISNPVRKCYAIDLCIASCY